MRSVTVLVALFSVALVTGTTAKPLKDASGVLQCVYGNMMSTLNNNLDEFMTFMKSLKVKDAAKGTLQKLRDERHKLQDRLKENANTAVKQGKECKEEGAQTPFFNPRCFVQVGTKFVFESGVALTDYAVDVATILTDDNADFHGANLQKALQMVKRLVQETGTNVKNTLKCFKDPNGVELPDEE